MKLSTGVSLRGALLVCALAVAAGCGNSPRAREVRVSGEALGTSYSVKVVAEPGSETEKAIGEIVASRLDAVDRRMSTYREESELSRISAASGGRPITVSPEMLYLLVLARQVGEASRGAFDITVAPLVDAWGFGPQGRPEKAPTKEELTKLRKLTGWKAITIDKAGSTVRKSAGGVRLDLSGIAKGCAVDRVATALEKAGYPNYMVEVGGEVRTGGVNGSGREWRIGIERPVTGRRALERVVNLREQAMATSGDYRNYWEENGVRYSHIIDPRTARPIGHRLASVSVLEKECARADAWATGLMVLGDNEGYEVATGQRLMALFLVRNRDGTFREKATPAFASRFGRQEGDRK